MKTHVNLISAGLFGEEPFPFQKAAVPLAFLALTVAILAGTGWEWFRMHFVERQIRDLQNRHAQTARALTAVRAETEMIFVEQSTAAAAARARSELIQKLNRDRIDWATLVQEISFVVPGNVWIQRIEGMREGKGNVVPGPDLKVRDIRIEGFARSYPDITFLMSELEQSRYFRNVSLIYAERKSTSAQRRINFELKASWTKG